MKEHWMNRRIALEQLDIEIVNRLFGSDPWPADTHAIARSERMFLQLGLEEEVVGEHSRRRTTAFGIEQRAELLMTFLGVGMWWDFLWTLEEHGLITEEEADCVSNLGETTTSDFMIDVMRTLVQRAYRSIAVLTDAQSRNERLDGHFERYLRSRHVHKICIV
jgi:hypothetical protein